MVTHLRRHDGRKCPIDISNPIVMLKGRDFGSGYARGSLVYPIAHEPDGIPGQHHSDEYMTVSTLNTDVANFCGVEIGKTAIPLRTLVETYGKPLRISYDGKRLRQDGKVADDNMVIDTMLDNYALMQLPEGLRTAEILSKVVSSETNSRERGIIFEKLENLAAAVLMYDMGVAKSSSATHDRLYADMWREDHPHGGVDDPSIMRRTDKAQLVSLGELMNRAQGRLVGNIVKEILQSGGKYQHHFDYDGLGTAFFKTSVEVEKVDDRYVLGIWAAYVGDKPEKELAEALERERSLVRADSTHFLSALDSGWVGVDLDKALRDSSLTRAQMSELSRAVSGEIKLYEPCVIRVGDMPIALSLALGQEENYHAESIRARGNRLFLETQGSGKPYISATLNPIGKDKIVNPEEKAKLLKARDTVSNLISGNLS